MSPLEIAITEQGFTIGHSEILMPLSLEEAQVLLGLPDRTKRGNPNNLLFWDTLGLWAYQPSQQQEISSLGVFFRKQSTDLPDSIRPDTPFTGSVQVGGIRLNAAVRDSDFIGGRFVREDDHQWRYMSEGLDVYIDLGTTGDGVAEIEITSEGQEGEQVKLRFLSRLRLAWLILLGKIG